MDILIVGAGGHGKVVLDIVKAAGQHRAIGFLDADPALAGASIHGIPVLGQLNLLPKLKSKARGAIVAIGDNRARAGCAEVLRQHGYELVNAVHPKATVSPSAGLGASVVIAAGASVGADGRLEDCVIVNTNAVVEHECRIEAAALAGRVSIGEMAFIGLGSRIIQCLSVGANSIVGAGAVVITDVPESSTVVGVPARVIKSDAPTRLMACPA